MRKRDVRFLTKQYLQFGVGPVEFKGHYIGADCAWEAALRTVALHQWYHYYSMHLLQCLSMSTLS